MLELIPKLKAEIGALEAEYQSVEDRIDRSGGVDYRGELAAIRKKLNSKRHELELWSNLRAATESGSRADTARLIVEVLIADEDTDTIAEIAANFMEDEIGRFDWLTNWQVVRKREDPVAKVQAYLDEYGIAADAQEIVNYIDQMTTENPGRWK